jgi:signal transduction histidine kinase
LVITVSDNGSGFAPGSEALALQPFYSTRREAGGTGMGLTIARSLLVSHGGTLRIVPATTGASLEITAPLA